VTRAGHQPSTIARERAAHRKRQTVRSVLIAATSTGVLGTLLVVAVTGAPGWDRVRQSFLDPRIGRAALPEVLSGLWLNVRLLVFCALGALALGLVVAVLRTLRGPVFFPIRAVATGYTYAFRGLPLIIVLYVLTLGVPGLRSSAEPPWCSPTVVIWPRSSGPASSRSIPASSPPPGRWA
jgi:polar amino acid transport system permease protein